LKDLAAEIDRTHEAFYRAFVGFGSWPCDNAAEGVSAGCDRRAALQGDGFEHIFPISVWEATWFIIGPT
jgi:hypothetical protein